MQRRFSKGFLFQLRNHIPVDALIRDVLALPTKTSEGHFRFLCPLCGDFHTATNPDTNLARCFRCQKNFNPIDLVMHVHGYDFVETIHFLQAVLPHYLHPPSETPLSSPISSAPPVK